MNHRMNNMKAVEAFWNDFSEHVLVGSTPSQRKVARRIFYAGAYASLLLILSNTNDENLVETLMDELVDFVDETKDEAEKEIKQ